jgi:hypothetical protein
LLTDAKLPDRVAAESPCYQQREEQFDNSFAQVLKNHGAFDAEFMAHYG